MENNLTDNITKKYDCKTCKIPQPINAFYAKNKVKCKRCQSKDATKRSREARARVNKRDARHSEIRLVYVDGMVHFYADGKVVGVEKAETNAVALRASMLLDLEGMDHFMYLTRDQKERSINSLPR